MKELKATVKLFDKDSDINEARKYMGKPILCFTGGNNEKDFTIMSIKTLRTITLYEDDFSFNMDDLSNYDKFAVIELNK